MDNQFKEMLMENEIDLTGTMARFMNNENLFVKFLYKFLEDKNLEGLKESLGKKDYEEAFKYAHTLKGVSANLGLNSISRPVGVLVERLRNKDYSDDLGDLLLQVVKNEAKLREDLTKNDPR